jgi:hypothetical protein
MPGKAGYGDLDMNTPITIARRVASSALLALLLTTLALTACEGKTSSTDQSAANAPSKPQDNQSWPDGSSMTAQGPLPEREGQRTGGALPPDAPDFRPVAVDPSKITPPKPPSTPATGSPAPSESTIAEFAGFTAPKPVTWQYRAPQGASGMRVAEYSVPGADGGDQADIIVYQFPGGGTVQANVDRWKGQFKRADNAPIEAKMQEIDADGMKVVIAELAGDYRGMGKSEYAPDQILVAGMIETDGNPVFVQLVGPSKTVLANREAFLAMMRGLKKSEPMK